MSDLLPSIRTKNLIIFNSFILIRIDMIIYKKKLPTVWPIQLWTRKTTLNQYYIMYVRLNRPGYNCCFSCPLNINSSSNCTDVWVVYCTILYIYIAGFGGKQLNGNVIWCTCRQARKWAVNDLIQGTFSFNKVWPC